MNLIPVRWLSEALCSEDVHYGGLKYADIPNGLAAVSKAPGQKLPWLQPGLPNKSLSTGWRVTETNGSETDFGVWWCVTARRASERQVPALGWAQIVAYFGFVEFSGGFEDYKSGTPGDYGWKVLTASNPEEKNKKLSAEIANGPACGAFAQAGLQSTHYHRPRVSLPISPVPQLLFLENRCAFVPT